MFLRRFSQSNDFRNIGYMPDQIGYHSSRLIFQCHLESVDLYLKHLPEMCRIFYQKGFLIAKLKRRLLAGTQVRLDASRSYDSEGDALSFLWWQQKEAGLDHQPLSIIASTSPVAIIEIPQNAQGKELHLVCEVHDEGPFHLVAYRRVIIKVE